MSRPYGNLSPFVIAAGEATAGGGGDGAFGSIPLDLASARYIDSDDIPDANSTGAGDSSGGILAVDTTPALERISTSTDKALRVIWVASNVDELQFAPVYMPPDLDATEDLTIHIVAKMSGATDTPTADIQAFDGIGDTEMGGETAALSGSLQELTVTISAADITGHPLGFLNVSVVPGAHGTDVFELYAAWIEYQSTFSNVGSENVTGTLNVREEQAANTDSGTFTQDAWQKRTLNTVVTNTISGSTLTSDVISLPAGTYEVMARAPAHRVDRHKARLRNTTDGADLIIGSTAFARQTSGDSFGSDSNVIGRFTLAAQKDIELQHRCETTQAINGFGVEANIDSKIEVYSEVTIRKIAI